MPLTHLPKWRDPTWNDEIHPFTVCIMIRGEPYTRQLHAKSPNNAVRNVIDDFYPDGDFVPWEIRLQMVFYGHCELCMVEDDPDLFEWD